MTRMLPSLAIGMALLVVNCATGHAQQFPVPGAKNPDWVLERVSPPSGMPTVQVLVEPDNTATTAEAVRSGVYRADTGQLLHFFDRRTGLFYDVEHGILHDRTTNQYYRFHRRNQRPGAQSSTRSL